MKINDLLNKCLTVEQTKGISKLNDRQRASVLGLGLRGGIGSIKTFNCCDESVLGMIKKISHILKISLIKK